MARSACHHATSRSRIRESLPASQIPPGSDYRAELATHGLKGSMGRRANPYDNAKAESFIKTLKVEEVCLGQYKTFEDVTAAIPRFIEDVYNAKRLQVIGVQTISKRSSPGKLSNKQGLNCPLKWVHSTHG